MKISLFWCGVFALCLFAACKKDNTTLSSEVSQPDPLLSLKDSCSFQVEGESYFFTNPHVIGMRNAEANRNKLDSVVKGVKYYSGDKDSVAFSRYYGFFNRDSGFGFKIHFIKKYNKKEMGLNAFNILMPENKLDLFQPGNYGYAVDYEKEDATNGIAVEFSEGGIFYSYSRVAAGRPTVITSESQQYSKFEIIRLVKLTNGTYLLEAKFNVIVFDYTEKVKKNIENGYLRLILY